MSEPAVPASARDLIPRLPRTFGPSLNEQVRRWNLLFPAEQRVIQAQIEWMAGLPPAELKKLFAPLVAVESKMDLPHWDPSRAGMTVEESGVLARSPLYPQWRKEVETVFSQIEAGVEKAFPRKLTPRLLICALPSGLPASKDPLWPGLAKQGHWVQLDKPFGQLLPGFASALARRKLPEGLQEIESTWVFECESQLSPLAETSPAIVLSWTALAAVRREFLNRLNTIRRDLKSVDQTNEDLKRLDLTRVLSPQIERNTKVREFIRTLLLSGNGSLVFNNSFVQWGASEALRRVQPQVMFAYFGIRPKIKPFSGSVLFEDQHRSNPTPDENDPAGSLVDGAMLAEYVYLAGQREASYQKRSVTIMAAGDLDRVLLMGDVGAAGSKKSFTSEELTGFAQEWLAA